MQAGSQFEYDIFFSYSSKDRDSAVNAVKELVTCGNKVFFAEVTLADMLGETYGEIINGALEKSRDFVLYCTANALASKQVMNECWTFYFTMFGRSNERRMVILNVTNLPIEKLPPMFQALQMGNRKTVIDFFCVKDREIENHSRVEHRKRSRWQAVAAIKIYRVISIFLLISVGTGALIYLYRQWSMQSVRGIEMVKIKGGKFGSVNNLRDQTVRDFYLSKTEITQRQWQEMMHNNPSIHKCDDCPVENVSLYDILLFIDSLNLKTHNKYRLPNVCEWQFAARNGLQSAREEFPGSRNAYDIGWFLGNSGDSTHAVQSLKPNESGLFDLAGNVEEWTASAVDDIERITLNPEPDDSMRFILTGNSFQSPHSEFKYHDITSRSHPWYKDSAKGFRLAKDGN